MRLTVGWETLVRRAISFWVAGLSFSMNILILLMTVGFPVFGCFRFVGIAAPAGILLAFFNTRAVMLFETSIFDFRSFFLIMKQVLRSKS